MSAVASTPATSGRWSYGQELSQLGSRRRNLFHDGPPHDIPIDIKLGVDEPIAHCDDCGPRYRRGSVALPGGDLGGRFPKDLNGTNERERQHGATIEIRSILAGNEALRTLPRLRS